MPSANGGIRMMFEAQTKSTTRPSRPSFSAGGLQPHARGKFWTTSTTIAPDGKIVCLPKYIRDNFSDLITTRLAS